MTSYYKTFLEKIKQIENGLPLVSVIVTNYSYLIQRLESIFNQTYNNIEVILLNDFRTDNSKKVLSKYAKNLKVSYCVFNDTNSVNTFIPKSKVFDFAFKFHPSSINCPLGIPYPKPF